MHNTTTSSGCIPAFVLFFPFSFAFYVLSTLLGSFTFSFSTFSTFASRSYVFPFFIEVLLYMTELAFRSVRAVAMLSTILIVLTENLFLACGFLILSLAGGTYLCLRRSL